MIVPRNPSDSGTVAMHAAVLKILQEETSKRMHELTEDRQKVLADTLADVKETIQPMVVDRLPLVKIRAERLTSGSEIVKYDPVNDKLKEAARKGRRLRRNDVIVYDPIRSTNFVKRQAGAREVEEHLSSLTGKEIIIYDPIRSKNIVTRPVGSFDDEIDVEDKEVPVEEWVGGKKKANQHRIDQDYEGFVSYAGREVYPEDENDEGSLPPVVCEVTYDDLSEYSDGSMLSEFGDWIKKGNDGLGPIFLTPGEAEELVDGIIGVLNKPAGFAADSAGRALKQVCSQVSETSSRAAGVGHKVADKIAHGYEKLSLQVSGTPSQSTDDVTKSVRPHRTPRMRGGERQLEMDGEEENIMESRGNTSERKGLIGMVISFAENTLSCPVGFCFGGSATDEDGTKGTETTEEMHADDTEGIMDSMQASEERKKSILVEEERTDFEGEDSAKWQGRRTKDGNTRNSGENRRSDERKKSRKKQTRYHRRKHATTHELD